MSNIPINVGNYVVATRDIKDIQVRSVGLVKKVIEERIGVFFIGASKVVETDINYIAYLDIKKTGKPYEKKICNICHQLKVRLIEFDINQTDAKGRKTSRPSCQICREAIDGKRLSSLDKRRALARKPKGIYTCPICQKTSIVDVTARFVIDHNHKTGKTREWICDSCNTGLGRFKDDPELFKRIIEYFKKYS